MKTKKKIWIPILIVIAISVCLLIFVTILGMHSGAKLKEVRVFNCIDEIDKQSEYIVKNEEVEQDVDCRELSVSRDYSCVIEYNGKRFYLYAYEFDNESSARYYFKNCTGISTDRSSNYSASGGVFFARFVAYNGKNAYKITGNDYSAMLDVLEIISADFSSVIMGEKENQ